MNISAYEQYRSKLVIDKLSLDIEVEQQPILYQEVSENVSEYISIRDEKKEALAIISAELSYELRGNNKSGKALTERALNEIVAISPKHKKATRAFLEAKKKAEIWGHLKSAYEQRASMLKVLAQLYTSNYFLIDSISTGKNIEEAVGNMIRKRISKDRTRRKKKRH